MDHVRAVGTVEVFLVRELDATYDLDDVALGRLGYDYVVVADELDAVPDQD